MDQSTKRLLEEFEEELDDIGVLSETPKLIIEHAKQTLKSAIQAESNNTAKTRLNNGIQSLNNISNDSIRENYKIIYSQMCILAVSSLEATLKKYFQHKVKDVNKINKHNDALSNIKITAFELLNKDNDLTQSFVQIINDRENNKFQSLKNIKEVFKSYFEKDVILDEEDEKRIIFYLELRNVLVHKSGIIDVRFTGATDKMKANLRNYKIGDKVICSELDWKDSSEVFLKLVKEIVK